MADRPILMSAPMVRAILSGAKTQTRRVVKGAPQDWTPVGPEWFAPTVIDRHGEEQPGAEVFGAGSADGEDWIRCPYGAPGDILWARESYMPDPPDDGTWAGTAWRGCNGARIADIPERFRSPSNCLYRSTWTGSDLVGWRPSIHMPRWASRITLEVTGVRVERLQDISEADAQAEGADPYDTAPFSHAELALLDAPLKDQGTPYSNGYSLLWESINGPGSWDANPWVWAIAFRRVT